MTAHQNAVNRYISWETNVLLFAESPPAAYSGFTQTALHKLDQLDSAIIIDDLDKPGSLLELLKGNVKDNGAFAPTISGGLLCVNPSWRNVARGP